MSAYAVAHLRNANMGADLKAYLRHVDATLVPFHGRFIIHGATPEVLEGTWSGDLIVVEFPDLEAARHWYCSANYQWIRPLRLANATGEVVLIDGVPAGHRATDILEGAEADSRRYRLQALHDAVSTAT